jgi:molybdopterin molybdotransferase
VSGLLARLGVEMIDMGVVRDEPAALEAAFTQAAESADAIITSGGVSVGEADHTKAMMQKLAGQTHDSPAGHAGGVAFWRIAMRPGRPMAVGRLPRKRRLSASPPDSEVKNGVSLRPAYIVRYTNSSIHDFDGGAVLFGLPGNPVAVMVTFLAFVRPALLQMMGSNEPAPPLLKAQSAEAIRKKPGRTEYQRGIVSSRADGQLSVKLTGNQGSGVLSSMTQANGLIVLHHDQGNVAAGDVVDVMMFGGVI